MRPIFRRRIQQGAYKNLVQEMRSRDEGSFRDYFRMSQEQFDYILSLTVSKIERKNTTFRRCVSAGERLAVTLRQVRFYYPFFMCVMKFHNIDCMLDLIASFISDEINTIRPYITNL